MKKIAILTTALLLALAILSTACTSQEPKAAAANNINGELVGASVPLAGNPTTLTVQTVNGPQTVQLAANTTYTLDGQACPIDDLGKVLASGNTTYNCTVVVDPCEPGIVAQYIALYTVTK